jgi:tRNA A-37 threonylcarbamoyl transferase component Bud32
VPRAGIEPTTLALGVLCSVQLSYRGAWRIIQNNYPYAKCLHIGFRVVILERMIPEKIGIYQIKSELGRGGMATVYLAYDPRFEREVAVKVLPREMLHDPQFRVRFEREAKTIAKLEHSGIVPVYDVGEEDGQPYFVMRYMTGGTLSDRLAKGPLTIPEAAHIIDRVASALDEAHAKGFIHRDLKPGNILFDRAGEPYISDFGIAKFSASQTNVTGSAIVGTPAYLSPEQAQGDANIDGRSDIYAVGVILFEMLSGRQPYEADTPMGVVVKQITDPVPHILDLNPNLPPEIEEIIEKAMAKNRDERFSTTREMADALEGVVRSGAASTTAAGKTVIAAAGATKITPAKTRLGAKPVVPAPVPAVQGKGKVSSFTWIIVGVVALCILVSAGVGGGLYLTRGNPLDSFVETPLEPTATERGLPVSSTETPVIPTTEGGVLNPTAESTIKPTDTLAPTPPPVVIGGGADKVAFLQDDNIWVMNLDGTELTQLTTDGAEKTNLQWLPDGKTILYIMGKAVKTVNIDPPFVENTLTSFNNAEYLEAFQVSRDGKSVAISMNRELYVLPFDVETLAAVTKKSELLNIIKDKGCLFYNDQAIKDVRWSNDGQKIAFVFIGAVNGERKDTIRVLDISKCSSAAPDRLDDFPGGRFTFPNEIVNFDWDGENLFFLNSNVRNDGFGNLVFYNMETHKYEKMAPLTGCCYRDATWSPDGSYVSFAFQDMGLGTKSPILLYYVPFASMTTGGTLEPIEGDLTPGFFTDLREQPWPVLHPEQP